MQILVLIGSSVSEVGQVKVRHFLLKRCMAYNNLHSTTVHAVIIVVQYYISVGQLFFATRVVATPVAVPISNHFLGPHPVHLCLLIVNAGHHENRHK
jgi:hypothetical protein